jgi:hypothetical protein
LATHLSSINVAMFAAATSSVDWYFNGLLGLKHHQARRQLPAQPVDPGCEVGGDDGA